ncbi:MAG: NUDIX domain-containing protein [Chloracidobacterium sp.]|nr:NUDIX domain-containing protein [Chloracidobacterium sp.]MCC6825791.1 NUDIX domain-containing protein [Acidobacteriota bacterium]MCO5332947.1 NUDIX domain-containing protein [Pyrinomonadaceae bacterium]
MLHLLGKLWKKMPPWARLRLTRATQHKFTASAAGIVTNPQGEVLLLDHLLRPGSGWGLPGGFIQPGEQPEAALRREIREETGLELTNVSFYRVRTFKRHVEVLYRANSSGEGRILSREIKQIRWFAADDIPTEMNLDQRSLLAHVFGTEI